MEDKLVEEYIGKDADKIINEKYNILAAVIGQIIGPIWFFYRKSYLLGFFFLAVTYFIGSVAVTINFDKAYYIMFFIYLFTTNKLYLWDVRRKVRKIISLGYTSEEQLISDVRKKGGTSDIAAIMYCVFLFTFIIFFTFLLFSAIDSFISFLP